MDAHWLLRCIRSSPWHFERMDYINKASKLSIAYRTLGEKDIDDVWKEVQDLQGKIVHRLDTGNAKGEDAMRERQRYANLGLAGMEKRAMIIFQENSSYKNLPIGIFEKLAKGERVENQQHDGNGALAHTNVSLVDFNTSSASIDKKQIIPYHVVSLLGCKSIQVVSSGDKKLDEPEQASNVLVLRPGRKKTRELLFKMWNDTMAGDSYIDEETLVYGYVDPKVIPTQMEALRDEEEYLYNEMAKSEKMTMSTSTTPVSLSEQGKKEPPEDAEVFMDEDGMSGYV